MPMNILPITGLVVIGFLGALLIACVVGRRQFHVETTEEIRKLLGSAAKGITPEDLAARREALPESVRRYLQYAIGDHPTAMRTVRLRHGGSFRTGPAKQCLAIKGEEYFTVGEPGFVWDATVRLAPLIWIEPRDRLIEGRGRMLVQFCSMFKLADAIGPELDQGALLRWLAEVVWFPIGYASDRISWGSIDSHSAQATLVHKDLSVSATIEMDEQWRIVRIRGQRYRAEGSNSVLTPWKGVCSNYRQVGVASIPASVEVMWELNGADFAYAKFEVSSIEHDPVVPSDSD